MATFLLTGYDSEEEIFYHDVPAARDDRMFPATWARRHARERLGIEADDLDGGHRVNLSRPRELAARLDAYAGAGP